MRDSGEACAVRVPGRGGPERSLGAFMRTRSRAVTRARLEPWGIYTLLLAVLNQAGPTGFRAVPPGGPEAGPPASAAKQVSLTRRSEQIQPKGHSTYTFI